MIEMEIKRSLPVVPESAKRVQSVSCSLVIPFYNEAGSIRGVLDEACAAMERLAFDYEVIAVDDGSSDGTRSQATALLEKWPALRILAFDRNRGQAAALFDGLRAARGQILITMDGDGQNDPADIPRLLVCLGAGTADMVTGRRANRKDTWLRRRMSLLANGVRRWFLRDGVSDSGCALKVFRREVREAFIPIRTLYSFMPALAVAAGYRVREMDVNHRARESGVSKYGLIQMWWRPLVDMVGVSWFARRRFQGAISTAQPIDTP